MSDRFFLLLAKSAVGRPWSVLLACIVLTVLASYASAGIGINTNTEGMLAN